MLSDEDRRLQPKDPPTRAEPEENEVCDRAIGLIELMIGTSLYGANERRRRRAAARAMWGVDVYDEFAEALGHLRERMAEMNPEDW